MAVTTLLGTLADDALLAAISTAEFGSPTALDPAVYQVSNLIVKNDPANTGEKVFEYDVRKK